MKLYRPYLYLAATLIIAALVWFVEKPAEEKRGDILNEPVFARLNTDKVARVEIDYLLDGVQIKKEGDQWWVAAWKPPLKEKLEAPSPPAGEGRGEGEGSVKWFKADGRKVLLALDSLLDTSAVSLAGKNPEKHGFFEVNPVGMHLKLQAADGQTLEEVWLGKNGPAFIESYFRREGQDTVYLVSRNLRGSFPAAVEAWRDRTLWDIAAANITGIEVERAKNPFHLKKADGKWQNVNPEKASQLAEQLSRVAASGFEDAPTATGLDKPSLTLTLTTDASPYILKLGRQNADKLYFAQKEGDPQIYLLRDTFDKIIPKDIQALE